MSTAQNQPIIPIHHFEGKALPFDIAKLNALTMKEYESARLPHRHNYYEIFIFYKGGGKHYIDFNTYKIEDHSMHFISPGQVHLIRRAVGCTGFVITFPDELFVTASDKNVLNQVALYDNDDGNPIVNCTSAEMAQIKQQVQHLNQEVGNPGILSLELIKMHLNIILIKANRFFTAKKADNDTPNPMVSGKVFVKQFKTLIDEHYAQLNEVGQYAELLAVSSGYLNDAVKKATGFTASTHIHQRIALEAKRLLYHSEYSVKEISFMLGFDDPAYFGRFFKKQIGQTPGDFRMTIREKYQE
jgi:AraC family transcriptional activator of pobA